MTTATGTASSAGVAGDTWRAAVLDLRLSERRRVFPATVHVGRPDGDRTGLEMPEDRRTTPSGLDHALRSDLVSALLARHLSPTRDPWLWLTRSGPLGAHDLDAAWHSAARAAYAEAGVPLAMAVVTHAGWYDPVTGEGRTWKRLRR